MQVITVIGDLVGSKRAPRRAALQRRLAQALARISADAATLASPYTLTLGDEFQAVYREPTTMMADVLGLLAAIHPVRARFAFGVGTLSTPINPERAIGMDGPAFHHARETIEQMKDNGYVWQVGAVPAAEWATLNHTLAFVGHHLRNWNANRIAILRGRLQGVPATEMAAELGISKVSVHKNIRAAALDEVAAICQDVTATLQRALAA